MPAKTNVHQDRRVQNPSIELEAHLQVEELEQAYRQAKDGVARSQWHMLWLLARGKRSAEVAAWMSAQLGYRVRAERGRDVLQRLGYSTKTPPPRHAKAEPAAQEAFKKEPA